LTVVADAVRRALKAIKLRLSELPEVEELPKERAAEIAIQSRRNP
jgi:hypothetical protein